MKKPNDTIDCALVLLTPLVVFGAIYWKFEEQGLPILLIMTLSVLCFVHCFVYGVIIPPLDIFFARLERGDCVVDKKDLEETVTTSAMIDKLPEQGSDTQQHSVQYNVSIDECPKKLDNMLGYV